MTASVTGTVTDNTGAVLKAAAVVAVNQAPGSSTRASRTTRASTRSPGLPIGSYVVKAEAQGFKSVTTNPITLETGQIARVNLKLELGAVTEQVEVVGVNPILQTENAVVGEVITGTTVVALPLNGRNFAQLALLAPGVQTHAPDSFTEANPTRVVGPPLRQRPARAEQQLHARRRRPERGRRQPDRLLPEPGRDRRDARRDEQLLGRVRQRGRAASSAPITKSGTNEFHGGAFVFARNDSFDANSWANNRSGAKKGDFSQHIFGGTLGGPLVKNKLFFFANYQGTRVNRPGEGAASVAPAEWRNGDFSSLLASGTVIRDPLTGQPFPGNISPREPLQPAGPGDPRQHHELSPAQPAGAHRQLREQPRTRRTATTRAT